MSRKYDSFAGIFERASREYPEKAAIIMDGQSRTYGELFSRAKRIAGYLDKSGIKKGDPVAVISSNSLDYIETVVGIAMAGAVVVLLNWRFTAAELRQLLVFNQVKLAFYRPETLSVPSGSCCPMADMDTMEERLQEVQPLRHALPRSGDEVLMHLHTSGTTGFPKVVRYTNAQLLEELEDCVSSLQFCQGTVFQMMSQLFHSASMGTYSCLAAGGTVVIFRRFDAGKYLSSIEKHKVTRLSAIPTVLTALLNDPHFGQYDLSSIQMINYSTCPMPSELIQRAITKFHCGFQQTYGMTEMGSIVTLLSPEDHLLENKKRLNSVGKPIKSHEIKIIDEKGEACRPGQTGEICVKGPGMMLDYYQMPEETRKVLKDGWYHTNDIGWMDPEGYLYVSGRKHDMIISGGENIFPAEIENILRMHPDITECSVLGIPDDYWGEAVHACVVLKEGREADGQQIREYCRGKIAGYKIPKQVHIYRELPHTATGKVIKKELAGRIQRETKGQQNM